MDILSLLSALAQARGGVGSSSGAEGRSVPPRSRPRTFADSIFFPHAFETAQQAALCELPLTRALRRSVRLPGHGGGGPIRAMFRRAIGERSPEAVAAAGLVPNALVARLCVDQQARMYNTAFFDDGRFALAGSQDATMRIFRVGSEWELAAEVEAQDVSWTGECRGVVTTCECCFCAWFAVKDLFLWHMAVLLSCHVVWDLYARIVLILHDCIRSPSAASPSLQRRCHCWKRGTFPALICNNEPSHTPSRPWRNPQR